MHKSRSDKFNVLINNMLQTADQKDRILLVLLSDTDHGVVSVMSCVLYDIIIIKLIWEQVRSFNIKIY